MENILILSLLSGDILISQIEEMSSELGEPDCKLVNPFVVKNSGQQNTLEPWMSDYTMQNTFMIHSDKILTLVEPRPTLLEKYKELIK